MQNKPVVAMLTDFGPDSIYVGIMKAVVCRAAPGAAVVDLSHSVLPQAVGEGSFLLDTVCGFFPPGTVFLAVVDPGVGGDRRNLIVDAGGSYFVGPDNGLFSEVISSADSVRVFEIVPERIEPWSMSPPAGRTFLGRDLFAPAAAALACEKSPADIGLEVSGSPVRLSLPAVDIQPGLVRGVARHVDSFGNILFAISTAHLSQVFGSAGPHELFARVAGRDLGPVGRCYADLPDGSLAALINSWDRVEIAVPGGNAMSLIGINRLSEISIEIRSGQ